MRCSVGSTSIRRRCGSGARPSSTLRHDQGSDGRNPLPDEDPATGCRRNGAARAGLQSHARHKHHGRPTASSGDDDIVVADMRSSPVAEPPKMAGIRSRSTSKTEKPPTRQNAQAWPPHRNRDASMLLPGRFHTTKTHSGHRPDRNPAVQRSPAAFLA